LAKREAVKIASGYHLQQLKPMGDIGCMVRSRFVADAKIGTEQRCAKFGNQFLSRHVHLLTGPKPRKPALGLCSNAPARAGWST
jgi:hypothetical protein